MRVSISLAVAVTCLGLLIGVASSDEPKGLEIIVNTFDKDREGWQIYDYNGGKEGGGNVFFPASWEKSGGVRDSGYIWADDSRWRIDTPETPNSILAFIIYRGWVGGTPLDLRNAEMSVYLRGDRLDLKGGKCLFWAFNDTKGTRWHYKARPLKIAENHLTRHLAGRALEPLQGGEFAGSEPPLLVPVRHDNVARFYTQAANS